MKILSVVGARPNFVKIAPFIKALWRHNEAAGPGRAIEHLLVHTGQHYDVELSRSFFEALQIPEADVHLEIGSGSHAEQVGRTMIAFEDVLQKQQPDWVVVVGDVNATCACSITAKKEHVSLAHIEAGLRSGDLTMPEEINRLVTDRLADLLFTPDRIADQILRQEGVAEQRIKFVGNIMIDTLEANLERAAGLDPDEIVSRNQAPGGPAAPALQEGAFAVMTMHRPSNVDRRQELQPIIEFLLDEVAAEQPLVWPVHPRARKQLEAFDLWQRVEQHPRMVLLRPVGYHDLLRLNGAANLMLTDSGGLQEECCVLGTPCLTLRDNTERPVTLQEHGGLSVLVGNRVEKIRAELQRIRQSPPTPHRPELWDGHTAERIVEVFASLLP